MPYRTVNLKPATYERLVAYKRGNLSLDDVVSRLMDAVPEGRFAGMLAAAKEGKTVSQGTMAAASRTQEYHADDSPDELGEI